MKTLSTIHTGTVGRPKSVRRKATNIIGVAGMAALDAADLHVVPGRTLREIETILSEAPPMPAAKPTQAPATTPAPAAQ